MQCADYQRWFSPYVDELLGSQERTQLEDHLKGCRRCRADLESLQQMLRSLRTMGSTAVPELLPGIHQRLEQESWRQAIAKGFAAPWPASLPWHSLALAATALLVVMLVGLPWYLRRETQGRLKLAAERIDWNETLRSEEDQSKPRFNSGAALQKTYEPYDAEGKREALATEGERRSAYGAESAAKEAAPASTVGQAASIVSQTATDNAAFSVTPANAAALESGGGALRASTEPAQEVVRDALSIRSDKQSDLVAEPPPPTSQQSTGSAPTLLQVQWQVKEFQEAASRVIKWVQARQGLAVATSEHHLSIQLPPSEVGSFLQQFSNQPSATPVLEQASLWVAISLELVSSE